MIRKLTKKKESIQRKYDNANHSIKEKEAEVKTREDVIDELTKKIQAIQKDNEWKESEISSL